MAIAKKKKAVGNKRHPVHAAAFIEASIKLREHAKNPQVDTETPTALLLLIADIFGSIGKHVQKIKR